MNTKTKKKREGLAKFIQQEAGNSNIRFEGSGPGKQTLDGCSIDFYLLLKPKDEPDIISANVRAGATILELGCGVGRITHPLVKMGYQVTAVDNSAEMLAHVHANGAETVCADIETLDLNRKFDAVLLMSHLINVPNDETRQAILQTCKQHLMPDGVVLVQCHNPAVWEQLQVGYLGTDDGIETYLDRIDRDGNRISATLRWCVGEREWSQSFETQLLREAQIIQSLADANLNFQNWLDEDHAWFLVKQ